MKASPTSLLSHALLGLLCRQPASGYELRRIFIDTPMSTFSDSPGSIYPALAKLERAELIAGTIESPSGLRQRRRYALTSAGRASLDLWLMAPVTRERVAKSIEDLLLQFAFLDETGHAAHAPVFLAELRCELANYTEELHGYLDEHASRMTASGRLALENGIRVYEAHLHWADHAAAHHPGPEMTP